jgi:hypothetical protein
MLTAAALGVFAWDRFRDPPAVAQASTPAPAATSTGGQAKAPSAVPAAAAVSSAGKPAPNFLRPASVTHATSSPLARDFGNALTLKPLYDRLKGSAEGETPEGQFFLYRILRACATVAERRSGSSQARSRSSALMEERRQLIAAELPEGDPRRALRLAALDKVATDQCEGLSGVTVTEAELSGLLRNALAGGDSKAKAWHVEQEMWQERRAAGPAGRGGPTLSDPQAAALRDAFVSRDPEAMVIAGRVLANSFRDVTVRIGPEQEAVENRAFANAALLLACEYGYACGENNQRVLSACAFQGHCGVASLPDYLFYYGASPYDAQVLDRYRNVLRQAIDSGDWSALTIQRGSRSPNAPALTMHGGGPGR